MIKAVVYQGVPSMRTSLATVSATALVVLGLTACTSASVFDIAVGTCAQSEDFADADGGVMGELPQIDCAEPHDLEAFATMNIEGDEFPGDDAAAGEASDFCLAEFETFVGTAYDESELLLSYFAPTEDSWDRNGDREILCWVQSPDQVTGTLKDSAR